jgi:hypothetical protein
MPTHSKGVEISFTNWVLGGSLVSVTSTESDRRRSSTRRVIVTEVDNVSPNSPYTASLPKILSNITGRQRDHHNHQLARSQEDQEPPLQEAPKRP